MWSGIAHTNKNIILYITLGYKRTLSIKHSRNTNICLPQTIALASSISNSNTRIRKPSIRSSFQIFAFILFYFCFHFPSTLLPFLQRISDLIAFVLMMAGANIFPLAQNKRLTLAQRKVKKTTTEAEGKSNSNLANNVSYLPPWSLRITLTIGAPGRPDSLHHLRHGVSCIWWMPPACAACASFFFFSWYAQILFTSLVFFLWFLYLLPLHVVSRNTMHLYK